MGLGSAASSERKDGLSRAARRELVLIKHVLMRYNGQLLTLYRRYSADGDADGNRLQLRQLWQLMEDADMLNPMLTRAQVSRLALFRLLNDPNHPTSVLGKPPATESAHDGDR